MELRPQEIASLRLVLQRISFLEYLKLGELNALISNLDKRPFKHGETIIKQGETGETFYIIASGSVGVYRRKMLMNKRIATLEKDSYFGEIALIMNEPRNATVIGETDGEVYFMGRDTFKKVLLTNPNIADLIRQTAEYRKAQNRAIELSS